MAKLFVSYSRKDADTAHKIIKTLKELEHDIWVDWEDIPPASDWMEQIKRGIEGVDAFLFLLSPDSAASGVCKDEVLHAEKNQKRIIPIVIRQVDPKDTIDVVRRLNWIFLRKEDKFTEGMERVNTAIVLDFEWVEEHTRLLNRALEWHRKKEPSLLLRGTDLWKARQRVHAAIEKRKEPHVSDLQKRYVDFSNRNQRRSFLTTALGVIVMIALAFLSYTAFTQRNEAIKNKAIAEENAELANAAALEAKANEKQAELNAQKALTSARNAIRQKQAAEKAKQEAEESRNLASAQRSAARAQIYQFRPGELYTSTLLAIASWLKTPSAEAEEILRENISLLPTPVIQAQRAGSINAVEFNAAGTAFVAASADGMVCAWQVSDGKMLFCANSPGSVNDAVFSPVENIIVSGDSAGMVQIIHAETGAIETQIQLASGIRDVDIRYDGRYAAITIDSGVIAIIDLRTRAKASLDLQAGDAQFATFAPKGLQIATGNSAGIIAIWELASNAKPFETRKHSGAILALKFSPNGRYLISGGADGAAVVLDAKTGVEVYRRKHNDQVTDIAFNSTGSWFVTVSNDRTIRVWATDDGEQLLSMTQSNFVRTVQVSKDDRWIASTGDDNTVRVWSAASGTELFQIPIKGHGSALGFSNDGNFLVAGNQAGYLNLWDITSIPEPTSYLQFNGETASALYSSTGRWIAASDDRKIWLLNPATLSPLKATPSGAAYAELLAKINRLVFSGSGARLGALTATNEIVIYNTQTNAGKTIKPENAVRAFVFSPDDKQVLVGDAQGGLQVWNAVTGQFISNAVIFGERITAMAAGNNLLAVGATNEMHLLDINTLQEVETLESQGTHELLAFSPDATLLASSNAAGDIHIWKQIDGKFTLQTVLNKADAASLAFNPANSLLAIGAADDVYLINLTTFEEYARIPHTGTVTSVSFSPDGATLLTASSKSLQFWEVSAIHEITTTALIETACQRLIENFSADQWDTLFGKEPFQALCPTLSTP